MAQSCRTFDVNRSSYRYWLAHKGDIDPEREHLKNKVSDAFDASNYSAGARTIAAIVSNDGTKLSRYRADKLMKELGLLSCQPSQPAYKKAEKLHAELLIAKHELEVKLQETFKPWEESEPPKIAKANNKKLGRV